MDGDKDVSQRKKKKRKKAQSDSFSNGSLALAGFCARLAVPAYPSAAAFWRNSLCKGGRTRPWPRP